MMMRFTSICIFLLSIATAHGQSKSEVGKIGVTLAVHQVKLSSDSDIRVADNWVKNQGYEEVTCELLYVDKPDMHKVKSITLSLADGQYTKRITLSEFTHGTIARVFFMPKCIVHGSVPSFSM